jgi:RNA polymerase sigma-70 factor (ECF subfamily)
MYRARKTVPLARNVGAHQLIEEARRGTGTCLGELLERYRKYLWLLAKSQLDAKLRSKISEADLVQDTMLNAYRDFGRFRGQTERQLLAWLRQILIHRLQSYVQYYVLTGKRDVRRECSLNEFEEGQAPANGSGRDNATLLDPGPSPCAVLIRQEDASMLAERLTQLPNDYRKVVILRSIQCMDFREVAARLGRSEGATRMLWLRAVEKLRQQVDAESSC